MIDFQDFSILIAKMYQIWHLFTLKDGEAV